MIWSNAPLLDWTCCRNALYALQNTNKRQSVDSCYLSSSTSINFIILVLLPFSSRMSLTIQLTTIFPPSRLLPGWQLSSEEWTLHFPRMIKVKRLVHMPQMTLSPRPRPNCCCRDDCASFSWDAPCSPLSCVWLCDYCWRIWITLRSILKSSHPPLNTFSDVTPLCLIEASESVSQSNAHQPRKCAVHCN